jgi:hypothetical protein
MRKISPIVVCLAWGGGGTQKQMIDYVTDMEEDNHILCNQVKELTRKVGLGCSNLFWVISQTENMLAQAENKPRVVFTCKVRS